MKLNEFQITEFRASTEAKRNSVPGSGLRICGVPVNLSQTTSSQQYS